MPVTPHVMRRFCVIVVALIGGGCALARGVTPQGFDAQVIPDDASFSDVHVDADAAASDSCAPQPEICNGADEDCDSRIDEAIPDQRCGAGPCAATAPGCLAGAVPTCEPRMAQMPIDLCGNSIDDECDGVVDGPTCSTLLLRYDADALPDDDGWTRSCIPGCPAGTTDVADGSVHVATGAGEAVWFTRSWAPVSSGGNVVAVRARGSTAVGRNAAYFLVGTDAGSIVVDFTTDHLLLDTGCSPTTYPLAEPSAQLTFLLRGNRVSTFLAEVMIDDRALCPSPSSPIVRFGTGNPGGMGDLLLDEVLAYVVP